MSAGPLLVRKIKLKQQRRKDDAEERTREYSKEVRRSSSHGDCSDEHLRVYSETYFSEVEGGGMD